jgi:hypothetical protein
MSNDEDAKNRIAEEHPVRSWWRRHPLRKLWRRQVRPVVLDYEWRRWGHLCWRRLCWE